MIPNEPALDVVVALEFARPRERPTEACQATSARVAAAVLAVFGAGTATPSRRASCWRASSYEYRNSTTAHFRSSSRFSGKLTQPLSGSTWCGRA